MSRSGKPIRPEEIQSGPFPADFDPSQNDLRDPSTWLALYLDQSVAIDESAKQALLRSMKRRSRAMLLPVVRPLARLTIIILQVVRLGLPNSFASSKLLHKVIYNGLKTMVGPESNYIILRHFCIGSEILNFLKDNIPGARERVKTEPLFPKTLEDLIDDTFLIHDLNVFNFVIQLSAMLREEERDIEPPEEIDFSSITDGPFGIEALPNGRFNVIDVQTAIESYTPMYQLFQTDNDFWRASNSLQLDEIIGIYVAKILGTPWHMFFVNNRHPVVPQSTLMAGWRLMLHGLNAEQLHYHLRMGKRKQAAERAGKDVPKGLSKPDHDTVTAVDAEGA